MEELVFYLFVVCVGLVFASFIKCLVDSEDKWAVLYRRSRCSSCSQQLRAIDLMPIVSYLVRRGRCSYCKEKIPLDIFFYEIFTFIILIFYFSFFKYFIFLNLWNVIILILLVFIAIEDVKYFVVVDELFYIFLLFNMGLLISRFSLYSLNGFSFFNLYDFCILIILFHILYICTRGGLGYGDIKVFCVLALNLNLYEGIYLLIFTFIYAGFFAISLLITKKARKGTKIPLVPFIALSYLSIILLREGLLW